MLSYFQKVDDSGETVFVESIDAAKLFTTHAEAEFWMQFVTNEMGGRNISVESCQAYFVVVHQRV